MLRTVLLASLALAITACATPATEAAQASAAPAAPAGDCFRNADINGFNVLDETHVRVRVGSNRTYVMTTDWPVTHLSWGHVLAIRSPSGWICTGDGQGIRIVGSAPVRSFYIQGIERGPDHVAGERAPPAPPPATLAR